MLCRHSCLSCDLWIQNLNVFFAVVVDVVTELGKASMLHELLYVDDVILMREVIE